MKNKVATLQSRIRLWNSVGHYQLDPTFVWVRSNGLSIHPSKMKTKHLFNALKLACDFSRCREHFLNIRRLRPRSFNLNKHYRQQAIANLFIELVHRPDLTKQMQEKLREIAASTVRIA